jgi:hypothetical protein
MPNTRSPRRQAKAAACLGLCGLSLDCTVLHAEEFFPVRDENPLTRAYYLPLPSDSRRDDAAMLTAAFSISNTVNAQARGPESLLVDGESDTVRLCVDAAPADGWRYRFTLPIIRDSGGFLDGPIESWHQFFGLPRGERIYYPRNQLVYFYSRRGDPNVFVFLDHPQTGIGDLSAEAGWFAADDAARTLSLWAGVQAPTGSVARLTGDGSWDAAAWSHWAWRFARWQLAVEAGVIQPFGDEIFGGEAHHTSGFARMAATRSVSPAWSLRAQLDGQSRRVDGDLRFLGPSLQLTLGAARRLHGRWRVEMGFSEDAAVNTAPDIGFFIAVHD